jgi:hypothetical protein
MVDKSMVLKNKNADNSGKMGVKENQIIRREQFFRKAHGRDFAPIVLFILQPPHCSC